MEKREPRKSVVLAAILAASVIAAGCTPDSAPESGSAGGLGEAVQAIFAGQGVRWVDLTHSLDEEGVYWPTAEAFELTVVDADSTDAGYWYAANRFSAAEHGGTHLDAPYHFAREGWSAEEIPLKALQGPAAVIDVRDSVRTNRDYRVRVADLEAWEAEHGRLPDGAAVLINSGWAERWPEEERVLGTDERGPEATDDLHFPGLHPDAARWLVEQREVDMVGLDTPSIDYGRSTEFMAHRILYGANVVGLENLARLEELPPSGAYVMALPMKIRGGSGGPARVVAVVPEADS